MPEPVGNSTLESYRLVIQCVLKHSERLGLLRVRGRLLVRIAVTSRTRGRRNRFCESRFLLLLFHPDDDAVQPTPPNDVLQPEEQSTKQDRQPDESNARKDHCHQPEECESKHEHQHQTKRHRGNGDVRSFLFARKTRHLTYP